MGLLQEKVVLVTGGAAGIGEAIVRHAAEAGAKLAILDLNGDAAQNLASQIEGARAYQANVASLEDMESVCDQIVADFGKLDGAVNNAGIGGEFGPVTACTPENWNTVITVNLTGVFFSMKAELKHMLLAEGGSIVNIASMAGILAEPNLPAYIAAKHGVVGLTKSVTIDYAEQGIRCNAVCPSFVRTPLTEPLFQDPEFMKMMAMHHPTRTTVTVEEVAGICTFLLSDMSSGMTGSVHLADNGAAAH